MSKFSGGASLNTNIVAAVFARGGSKGLPGKNLRRLGGKTLLALAIEHALAIDVIDQVFVSTDSEEIATEAIMAGAIVPFVRPESLARDNSPEWFAWRHLLDFVSQSSTGTPDYLLSIPATAPLRALEDVQSCISVALGDDSLDGAICVTPSRRNPDFNMARLRPDGSLLPPEHTKKANLPFRRQDADSYYEIVPSAYVMKANYVMTADSMWAGKLGAHVVPEERSIDIDSEFDFILAEFLYNRAHGA